MPPPTPPATHPRVSIGMPVYNGEKFIRKALDSLLAQTFSDFELTISDNCSTDGTEIICREYAAKDLRIRFFKQPENMGPLANFNFVLEQAVGQYFMWAAADDLWNINFMRRCVERLDNFSDIGICSTRYWILSRQFPCFIKMKKFPDMSFLHSKNVFERVPSFILLDGATHKANAYYGIWRIDLAKQVMDLTNGLDEYVYSGLDLTLLTYALTKAKIYQIPEVLFYKTYKRFPVGSFVDKIFHKIMKFLRPNKFPSIEKQLLTVDEHIGLLENALTVANVMNSQYAKVLSIKRSQMVRNVN